MGLVEYLRDRGEETVETAIQTFLAVATSRPFDVIEIRCDGEKTVGTLIAALNTGGIRVQLAGPGQHISVVERMIQTLKRRHRWQVTRGASIYPGEVDFFFFVFPIKPAADTLFVVILFRTSLAVTLQFSTLVFNKEMVALLVMYQRR
jgi:hypothetical protein